MEKGSISLQLDHNFCLAACCAWQMLTSVERRSPVVSRIAPTTPGVMNATALQDTDSTQTGVAAMVMFYLQSKRGRHLHLNETQCLILLNSKGKFRFDTHNVAFVLVRKNSGRCKFFLLTHLILWCVCVV